MTYGKRSKKNSKSIENQKRDDTMRIKTVYIVFTLERTVNSIVNSIPGTESEIKLSWADRMCGAMPVFETKKAAEKYAGKKYMIRKAEIEIRE